MAATEMAAHPKTLAGVPRGVLTMRIPPKMTTPDKLLLVLISGVYNAGSTAQTR
jgi:hypothetical protein